MRPWNAWALVVVLGAASVAAFIVPFAAVVGAAVVGILAVRRHRWALLVFAAMTIAINVLLLAWLAPGPDTVDAGLVRLGVEGAWEGLQGAARLVALVAVNLAVLSWLPPTRWLEGLRLPPQATGLLAAILIASHDLARDHARLREARALDGGGPPGRWGRILEGARLLPALMVAAHHRARIRADALRLAGIATGPRFAPLVAVTALAVAGRLALVALPNVSLTYVVVFLGGMVWGAWVGATAGLLAMALTNLLLTGLLPTPFVNAPAMALVGLAGGALRRFDWDGNGRSDRIAGRLLAATVGILATFAFSVAADTLEWYLVPEFRSTDSLLTARILAGLAFNAVPALTNGVLFALAVTPVHRAFTALRSQPKDPPAATDAP